MKLGRPLYDPVQKHEVAMYTKDRSGLFMANMIPGTWRSTSNIFLRASGITFPVCFDFNLDVTKFLTGELL